jgi:hypothetical protein
MTDNELVKFEFPAERGLLTPGHRRAILRIGMQANPIQSIRLVGYMHKSVLRIRIRIQIRRIHMFLGLLDLQKVNFKICFCWHLEGQ